MKIKEIETYERDYLTPQQVSEVLGCSAYSINLKAKAELIDGIRRLPFPVVMMGNRVKIPRQAFLRFWYGEIDWLKDVQKGETPCLFIPSLFSKSCGVKCDAPKKRVR